MRDQHAMIQRNISIWGLVVFTHFFRCHLIIFVRLYTLTTNAYVSHWNTAAYSDLILFYCDDAVFFFFVVVFPKPTGTFVHFKKRGLPFFTSFRAAMF